MIRVQLEFGTTQDDWRAANLGTQIIMAWPARAERLGPSRTQAESDGHWHPATVALNSGSVSEPD